MSKDVLLETFGCQMNAHDSEKVVGTLPQQGYCPGSGRRTTPISSFTTPVPSATKRSRRSFIG